MALRIYNRLFNAKITNNRIRQLVLAAVQHRQQSSNTCRCWWNLYDVQTCKNARQSGTPISKIALINFVK